MTFREKLKLSKETLEFLLDTNEDDTEINSSLVNVINFIEDELEFAIGLK